MKAIIFTDLDGTLLNHHDYSYDEAKVALKKIKKKKVPLIFTTSKTKIEVEKLHKRMQIQEPFIVENGAAIFIPKNYHTLKLDKLKSFDDNYYVLQLGKTYKEILSFYNKVKKDFGLKGFSDMDINEIMVQTNLPIENATLSSKRNFTEPFILKDESKLEELKLVAKKEGIKITKGGRFYHLIGELQDKGKAVKEVISLFKKYYKTVRTIALGDSENDIEMLLNVDVPIVIKNHKDKYISIEGKKLEYSSFQASKGWNEMVLYHV